MSTPRRRLVVTCADSWGGLPNQVTNIEKLSRCVEVDPQASGGVPQILLPQSGRGTTASTKSRLGHWPTRGLAANLVAAYRFLCYNYLPGDEIFVLGAARGALTARQLAAMVGRFGLLDRSSSVRGLLPQVVTRFQSRTGRTFLGDSDQEFRDKHCLSVPITFLGVFETLGPLGIPGRLPNRRQGFHDAMLSHAVVAARQALAIDEPRVHLPPSLWFASPGSEDQRIRQVWFPGCHGDVAGGYAHSGLADTAMLWMVSETARHGLVWDRNLLAAYLRSGRGDPIHAPTRTHARRRRAHKYLFDGRLRRLHPDGAQGVRVASSALRRWEDDSGYRPANLAAYLDRGDPAVEEVVRLPDADWSL